MRFFSHFIAFFALAAVLQWAVPAGALAQQVQPAAPQRAREIQLSKPVMAAGGDGAGNHDGHVEGEIMELWENFEALVDRAIFLLPKTAPQGLTQLLHELKASMVKERAGPLPEFPNEVNRGFIAGDGVASQIVIPTRDLYRRGPGQTWVGIAASEQVETLAKALLWHHPQEWTPALKDSAVSALEETQNYTFIEYTNPEVKAWRLPVWKVTRAGAPDRLAVVGIDGSARDITMMLPMGTKAIGEIKPSEFRSWPGDLSVSYAVPLEVEAVHCQATLTISYTEIKTAPWVQVKGSQVTTQCDEQRR